MRPFDLIRFKQSGRPITMLTAWDCLSAALVEAAGADVVLVGDSLGMVALGHATTLPVTLDQMLHHKNQELTPTHPTHIFGSQYSVLLADAPCHR